MAPYRQQAEIEKYVEPVKPKYGLIKKPGPNLWRLIQFPIWIWKRIKFSWQEYKAKHYCSYPKRRHHFWAALMGESFGPDSMYRCLCGKIYYYNGSRWLKEQNSMFFKWWIDNGGEL